MGSCRSCALVARRDQGEAPDWDCIERTPRWDVVHCYGTSLEGWIVLVLRRHAATMADLTDAEAAELGPLVRDVSRGLAEVVACEKTYAAQFAEAPGHNHVHVHVIPRRPGMPPEERGPNVFSLLPRQALDDPSRREDLFALLREMRSHQPPDGAVGMSCDRVERLLGIDPA
jgi:diadenosine tetraphosphate (Ap4A) HIT family hydrolase